ncbi:MAG: DUF3244 domain-containing protein [Bacteroidaceae bacterium]|nr:DUF3244 domain-containing protein [Bacteroidaceae bacterium]
MKRLVILLLMICPVLASAQTVSNVQNSGCLSETRGAESQRVPTIILTKEGSTLSVQLVDYESDCCTEDFNVTFSIASGSNYDVCEVSISPISEDCDCVCPYNVSFTVRDLAPNEFYLYCWWYKGMVNLTEGEPLVLEYKVMTDDVMINETSFPDINFRNWLLSQEYGADGVLTDEELKNVTSLDVRRLEIHDLKGIEYFTALKYLNCMTNKLTTLDLSHNTALEKLECVGNRLTTINLRENKKLRYLGCPGSNPGNQLTTLDVSRCTELDTLACSGNPLKTLDVSKNTKLICLECYSNLLTSLDLSKNTALRRLQCNNNQLTALDVSKNTALTFLLCSNNLLTTLDVSKNTSLATLSCMNNQLETLNVSNNKALKQIFCFNNQLTKLDASGCTALKDLECYQNRLTDLIVEGCTSLTTLSCLNNQIKGTAMDALVESLPTVSEGRMEVIYFKDEQNAMTTSQVAAAKAKGWTPIYWTYYEDWQEYAGSEPKESHYYYYNGKKIPLTLNENKVIVSIPKECDSTSKRIRANVSVLSTIQDKVFDIFIIPRSDFERLTSQNFWEEDAKSVVLTSSYYSENNKEVYETPYLNVKLKKEEDANLLDSYAEKYKLKNLGSFSQNLPLWYILHVTPNSDKSPLECANELYESGFFASSVPDFASDNVIELPYRQFVEDGKAWTYHYHGYNGREFNVGRIIDGDTIISGQAYKKIYDKVGGQYQYALREEGKKVYMVDDHYETESLLYDFSKDAGDVIDELVYPLIVASVDTIDIDGVKFRRMRVQDANQPVEEWDDEMINMYNFWIEGVGSECLLESSIRGNGNYYNLLSCQINGRVYTQQELLATNPKKIGLDQYLPFVQAEKRWTVNQLYVGKENLDEMTYTLSYDEVSENGNQYYPMSRSLNGNLVDDEPVLIREKNRRVYLHFPYTEYEYLLFDYSLKKGDTYWTYSLDERKAVKYEVLSVSDFTEGPEFVYREYDEKGDSMKTCVRYLRKWVVERTDMPIQKTWIEGVGSLEGPLANFYDAARNSGRDYLAYVELGVGDYLPFEFYDTVTHQWHGCNLPTGAEDNWDEDFHKLTYELEGDRLHIYGEALTQCAPNNYAYFKEEPTEDPLTYRIRFYIQEVEPMVDCMALHATNFYVSGFNPNLNYIVVDNQGVEHPVINRTPQDDYRQFVEDGKVWKVGIWSGNPVRMVEYFYFDGDTIVGGKACKRMWCQQYGNEGSWYFDGLYRGEEPNKQLYYIGVFYEEDKKVYFQPWEDQLGGLYANDFWLLYDFSVMPGDTIFDYVMTAKASGGMPEFKGTYYDLTPYTEPKEYEEPLWNNRWLEGVGRADVPYYNLYNGETGHYTFLMSCTVGDEVIYLNDKYEDGTTPIMETKKRRFDFTHTVKIQPKTPQRRGEETALYGEYNDQSLDIRLDPLDGAYSVSITNQKTGETLYEKNINAGSIVALNIDISKYAEGQYKISIDNSNETFNGVFDTSATEINEIMHNSQFIMHNDAIFNLQGQRIKTLQKGLNIVDGKKILVK